LQKNPLRVQIRSDRLQSIQRAFSFAQMVKKAALLKWLVQETTNLRSSSSGQRSQKSLVGSQ
jgi:hypothetical protein